MEYNKKITDTKSIIKRLTEINNLIAYLDIRELSGTGESSGRYGAVTEQ